jgi:type VI secretion system protein ImpA
MDANLSIRQKMNTSVIDLDIDPLLRNTLNYPPCGVDLRQSDILNDLYYKIKETRRFARDIERSHSEEVHYQDAHPHWKLVKEQAEHILIHHSKDIEIIAYLIEALLREHALKGLAAGFFLASYLIEQHWEELHPIMDAQSIEARIASLAGLNGIHSPGTLILPISWIPITGAQAEGPYAFWQYRQALLNEKKIKASSELNAENRDPISLSDIKSAIQKTPLPFYTILRNDLTEAESMYQHYCQILDLKCGSFSPASSAISQVLKDINTHLTYIEHDFLETWNTSNKSEINAEEIPISEPMKSDQISPICSEIKTNEQAFALLHALSHYFSHTQPHSPLSYLLDRCIHWGKLSLPQLFNELINDELTRQQIGAMTGIPLL